MYQYKNNNSGKYTFLEQSIPIFILCCSTIDISTKKLNENIVVDFAPENKFEI